MTTGYPVINIPEIYLITLANSTRLKVKQLKILLFLAAIMKMCLSGKMLNIYKVAYIGFEISTFKFTRIH